MARGQPGWALERCWAFSWRATYRSKGVCWEGCTDPCDEMTGGHGGAPPTWGTSRHRHWCAGPPGQAVKESNALVDQGIKVGGIFHSTCCWSLKKTINLQALKKNQKIPILGEGEEDRAGWWTVHSIFWFEPYQKSLYAHGLDEENLQDKIWFGWVGNWLRKQLSSRLLVSDRGHMWASGDVPQGSLSTDSTIKNTVERDISQVIGSTFIKHIHVPKLGGECKMSEFILWKHFDRLEWILGWCQYKNIYQGKVVSHRISREAKSTVQI